MVLIVGRRSWFCPVIDYLTTARLHLGGGIVRVLLQLRCHMVPSRILRHAHAIQQHLDALITLSWGRLDWWTRWPCWSWRFPYQLRPTRSSFRDACLPDHPCAWPRLVRPMHLWNTVDSHRHSEVTKQTLQSKQCTNTSHDCVEFGFARAHSNNSLRTGPRPEGVCTHHHASSIGGFPGGLASCIVWVWVPVSKVGIVLEPEVNGDAPVFHQVSCQLLQQHPIAWPWRRHPMPDPLASVLQIRPIHTQDVAPDRQWSEPESIILDQFFFTLALLDSTAHDVRSFAVDQTHTIDDHVDVAGISLKRDAVWLSLQHPVEDRHWSQIVGLWSDDPANFGDFLLLKLPH